MLHNISMRYKNIKIRPLHADDIELLRQWRNDQSFTQYIRKFSEITSEMQLEWFKNDCADPDCYTFAIEELSELKRFVGSVSLYRFRDKVAECGCFFVGDADTQGKGIGRLGIILCMYAGFEVLRLSKIGTNVHENNTVALTTNQKAGFKIIGQHPYPLGSGNELDIECLKSNFCKLHGFLEQIAIISIDKKL